MTQKQKIINFIITNGNDARYTDILRFIYESTTGFKYNPTHNRGYYSHAFSERSWLRKGDEYIYKNSNGRWSAHSKSLEKADENAKRGDVILVKNAHSADPYVNVGGLYIVKNAFESKKLDLYNTGIFEKSSWNNKGVGKSYTIVKQLTKQAKVGDKIVIKQLCDAEWLQLNKIYTVLRVNGKNSITLDAEDVLPWSCCTRDYVVLDIENPIVKTKSKTVKPKQDTLTVDHDFLQEAYEAADSKMKSKLKSQFKHLNSDRYFTFKDSHTLGTSYDGLPFMIALGLAKSNMEMQSLHVSGDYEVIVEKSPYAGTLISFKLK